MATKQTRHWYDRVAKTEKLPKGAWQSQYVARKLEKFSREGYRLVKVTNDMYSFDETEPAERKYFVMNINGYDKKSKKNPCPNRRDKEREQSPSDGGAISFLCHFHSYV